MRQPLAAVAVGLLLAGQIALELTLISYAPPDRQPPRQLGADASRVMVRTWSWLMAAMLVAAVALA